MGFKFYCVDVDLGTLGNLKRVNYLVMVLTD